MIDELFVKRVFVPKKAVSFGFKESDGEYVYEAEIMNGEFRLYVLIRPDGRVDTRLIETETDEEYTLYKTEAVGTFVGRVRTSVEEVLCLIAEKCFDSHLFASPSLHGKYMGKQWKQCQTLFFWAPKSLQMVIAAMKLKDAYSLEGKL